MFGFDPLTPSLLAQLYRWLSEIESARESDSFREWREPFNGAIERRQLEMLESNLRSGFLLFCDRVPNLAVDYLQSLVQRRFADRAIHSVLKFRGTLAKAAPVQLAEFTLAALLPKETDDTDRRPRGPFEHTDHDLYPASPAQGPFLELLTAAPEHGLPLVRKIVDHAIAHYSGGRAPGSNGLTIQLSDVERRLPWTQSYAWSREWGGRSASVTSALMALEAWAHQRLDAGTPIEQVLKDVLDYPGASAAFVLIAVDLVLSHWPRSADAAISFVGCPELLCLDRDRQSHEGVELSDVFGLRALQTEPMGSSSLKDLARRPSRRKSLYDLIGEYAFGPLERRDRLASILRYGVARLGAPDAQSTLADPTFMAVHALNLLDPGNWRDVIVEGSDEQRRTAHRYVSPESEARHLEALQAADGEGLADIALQARLSTALEDPKKGSAELAAAAVDWAQRAEVETKNDSDDEGWMRDQAILAAAVIGMRDGAAEIRAKHERWARAAVDRALQTPEDSAHRFRRGLRYNPIAMAFFGIALLLKDGRSQSDVRTILALSVRADPAAAHGFRAAAAILASIDERLPRSVLRCAFIGRVYFHRYAGMSDADEATREQRREERATLAIEAELKFLSNDGPEPAWPTFPQPAPRLRKHLRLPGVSLPDAAPVEQWSAEESVDHQAAALWLHGATDSMGAATTPWLRDVVAYYAEWTAALNRAGHPPTAEISERPSEWNRAYFDLLARCIASLTLMEIDGLALDRICSLPDESFFDVVAVFLYSIDAVYFGDRQLSEEGAVHIRSVLAKRLAASRGWRRLKPDRSGSIEMHLGPAVAVLFFNEYTSIQQPRCYLLPKGVERIDPFIPTLDELIKSGGSLFVALVALNMMEVAAKGSHLRFLVAAVTAWLEAYPEDSSFWVDQKIGLRVCSIIDTMRQRDPTLLRSGAPLHDVVGHLLTMLVRLGVPEASRLERTIEKELQ